MDTWRNRMQRVRSRPSMSEGVAMIDPEVTGGNVTRLLSLLHPAAHYAGLKAGKGFLLAGVMALLNGCSSYSLISYSPSATFDSSDQWNELKVSRKAVGPVEEAVVEAAKLRSFVKTGQVTATCLAADEKTQIVVAAVGADQKSDPMAPKSLTSYRVVGGEIDAFMEPVTEPSPDVDYEATVYSAAMGALTNRNINVVIYNRPGLNLVFDASIKNECVIKVKVMAGVDKTGEVVSERIINICNIKAGYEGITLSRGVIPPGRNMR